ncbi:MAG: sigma 54-interacting transcriptional regulator, partial [Candidatus Riflebacteria bacterium]|nr:sigma 54-interacting transcriptional regulator [Candidatus Riflebacteria bacterium]
MATIDDPDETRRVSGSLAPGRTLRLKEGVLLVIEGPDQGRRFVLKPPVVRLGKSRENDIVLGDDTVSKLHLSIEDTPDGFVLRDLNSTNGTFLNSSRIREAYLSPGATIRLGATVMRFEPPGDKIQVLPSSEESFEELKGASLAIREIFGVLEKVAPTDATILVTGETGSGKEVVARSIHRRSSRAAQPFVVFDCSAVAHDLVESALFGHREGAFTGATGQRKGAFLTADGGTIFIDEIGEMPLDLQPKLLRVMEMREVQRLGTDHLQKVDVRVIAATHRDLREMVKAGQFRQDLYYRLSIIDVTLPPLRDRRDDIPILVDHFLARAGRPGLPVTEAAMHKLTM